MAANRFASTSAPAAAKKPAKKAKVRKAIKDLHQYAVIQAAKKTLETLESTFKASVNEQALEYFVENATDASFEGFEGETEASLQLRKRTSRSMLQDNELEVLRELGIAVQSAAAARFVVNNAYADDTALLEKVSKALDGVDGIPADFIQVSPEKYVVGETALADTFRLVKDKDQLRTVLQIVGTLASRPVFGGNHEEMVKMLGELLQVAKDGPGFGDAE